MSGVQRVTGPLLDVLEVLVEVHRQGGEVHGWDLMKTTRRAGPTVYRVLDRLEDAGWVAARWEDAAPDPSRPRRRFYRLNPDGLAAARTLLAERRPAALDRTPRPSRPAPGTTFRRLFRPRPASGTLFRLLRPRPAGDTT